MYITSCYITPSRLFIIGGGEILSKEGTIQGGLTAMGAYAKGILPLFHFLFEFISINHLSAKEVAFADDFTVAGKLTSIRDYWENQQFLAQRMVTSQKLQNHT